MTRPTIALPGFDSRPAARLFGRAATLAALLAMAGCDTIGNPLVALGRKPPAPDEFQVVSRAPLRMPASADLPTPRPGVPSPLEPDPRAEAIAALGGSPAAGTAAAPSPGEAAILESADAASADPAIRTTLAEEAAEEDGAYERPNVFELIGLSGGDPVVEEVDPGEALDPVAESQRLQREGVRAPNDPEARAPEPEELAEEEAVDPLNPDPFAVPTESGPQRNRLTEPEPAF